jgi:hypothetical protein
LRNGSIIPPGRRPPAGRLRRGRDACGEPRLATNSRQPTKRVGSP